MADAFLGLTELLRVNDANLAEAEVNAIRQAAPVITRLSADTAMQGTQHTYLRYITEPAVGFRAVNVGRENKKSVDETVTVTCKLLDASFTIDKALATAYRGGAAAYVAMEARRHLAAALFKAEKQVFYGAVSPGDTSGFTGLGDNAYFDKTADTQVIDAGGSTASTGSSCWLIRTGPTDVQVILGNDGLISMGETVEQAIEDTGNGGRFTGLYTSIMGYMGLQIGASYSAVRIANLTEDSGKGLTDDLIASAMELFPSSYGPTFIACNRRSLRQLQSSRTATNPTGAPAPFPQDAFGVPIIVTDGIVSTESIVTAS